MCVCVCVCVRTLWRRGKDYSRPVGFVSAGVQGGTRPPNQEEGDEEGSESDEEVCWNPVSLLVLQHRTYHRA